MILPLGDVDENHMLIYINMYKKKKYMYIYIYRPMYFFYFAPAFATPVAFKSIFSK